MLGKQISAGQGKRTGRRVLTTQPQIEVETSFEEMGATLGLSGLTVGTYTAKFRPDGTLFGEGQGVFASQDGGLATWKGVGTGKLLPDGSVSYRGALVYNTSTPALAALNGVAGAFEFDVDPAGNTQSKAWEWK